MTDTQRAAMTAAVEALTVCAREVTNHPDGYTNQFQSAQSYAEDAVKRLQSALAEPEWYPISEAHEDFGVCAFIDIEDPDPPTCASTLDDDYEQMAEACRWTHFLPIRLSTEEAERLIAEMPPGESEAA